MRVQEAFYRCAAILWRTPPQGSPCWRHAAHSIWRLSSWLRECGARQLGGHLVPDALPKARQKAFCIIQIDGTAWSSSRELQARHVDLNVHMT